MLTIFLSIVLPGFLATMGQGLAQRPVPASPPPMAETAEVKVYRGQSVEIPLRAGGRIPGPLRFVLRTRPTQGSLGEPRAVDRNTAVITYTHDPKYQGGADSFRFAVQAVDSPVSAPAEILIRVQEPPAKLETIPSLDFGEVPAGSHTRKKITVKNSGGTTITTTPSVSPPWSLEETKPQSITPGASQEWTVIFSPSTQGNHTGEFRVAGSPPTITALSGHAMEIFSVSPDGPLILSDTPHRKASIVLKNRIDNDLVIQVDKPKGILAESDIKLPARSEVTVEVSADPNVMEGISGSLVLTSRGFRKDVPVRSEAVPAILLANPAAGFLIPLADSSEQLTNTLLVENQGGSPARMEVRCPPGVVIVPDPSSVIIAPGKSHKFEVSIERSGISTDERNVIEILAEGAKPITIPLRFEKPPNVKETADVPLPKTAPIRGLLTSPSLHEAEPTNDIPAISEIRLVSKAPGVVEIAWNLPSPRAKSYVIEYRTLEYVADNAPPLSKWSKFPYARFKEGSGEVFATMTRLPPDSSWDIRVVSIDAAGKRSEASESFRIASPPHPPRPWLLAGMVGLIVCGGIGFVVRSLLRKRKTQEREEAKRISRLEGE